LVKEVKLQHTIQLERMPSVVEVLVLLVAIVLPEEEVVVVPLKALQHLLRIG